MVVGHAVGTGEIAVAEVVLGVVAGVVDDEASASGTHDQREPGP